MIRVAFAEDHLALIDGIKLLLKYEEGIEIVGTTSNGEDLLNLVRLKEPNVVITDIQMPKMDGITATKIIKKEFPHIKVLAFTMFDQIDAIKQMVDAGASGYLLKNSALEEILKAIISVHQGRTYFDANIEVNIDSPSKKKKGILTNRQREILRLIGEGKTSKEIAEELFIGVHTVDTHRKNMVRILGLHGKGELMRYALEKKYTF